MPAHPPMDRTLYLSSTPLHSFFALGLMNGAWQGHAQTLALVDQHEGARDFIGEALQASSSNTLHVHRFAAIDSQASGQRVLRAVSELSGAVRPSTIAVGNDCRLEFYAAIRGCPGARRVYIDDGLYSYVPHRNAKAGWREAISDWRRSVKYGLPLERPSLVGGSRAVQQAYVLLPQQVHDGLARKLIEAIQPAWFADTATRNICIAAAALAGVDAVRCGALQWLLLLPHPQFLVNGSPWAAQLGSLAAARAACGETVAIKPHPAAQRMPLREMLPGLPASVVELPARLPVEVLLPLLSATQIVGAMTTSLLTLRLLGQGLTVYTLPSSTQQPARSADERRVAAICESVGIKPLIAVPERSR